MSVLHAALNCTGRGYVPEGADKCVCQNPLPSKGTLGFGGPNCDISEASLLTLKLYHLDEDLYPEQHANASVHAGIFGAEADGTDMTAACRRTGCNFLQPNEWMCFSVPFAVK